MDETRQKVNEKDCLERAGVGVVWWLIYLTLPAIHTLLQGQQMQNMSITMQNEREQEWATDVQQTTRWDCHRGRDARRLGQMARHARLCHHSPGPRRPARLPWNSVPAAADSPRAAAALAAGGSASRTWYMDGVCASETERRQIMHESGCTTDKPRDAGPWDGLDCMSGRASYGALGLRNEGLRTSAFGVASF